MDMSTLDSDFLIITAVCLSLFFLIAAMLTVYAWIVFHALVKKAEMAIENVESVTQVIKDVGRSGSATNLLKLLKFVVKLSKRFQ